MPVNPEVLRDLIRRFGSAAVKAAKEKVMVPDMTDTATVASISPGSPVGEGDPDFVGPPTPFPVMVANSTYREYDDGARKYDGKYPNIAYYLRNSGKLRGQRLGANEAMILDWPPESLMRIRGTKNYNVPVTKAALDSMALNGAKAGVSPEVALGIPAQETALGFYPTAAWIPEEMRSFAQERPDGYAANRWQITPIELMNDAAYANDPYGSSLSYVAKKLGVGVPLDDSSYKLRNNLSAEELARVEAMLAKDRGYADSQARRAGEPGSVFRHAYELYKSGQYNPGDPNYNNMVEAAGADVFTSPQIQDWWNTSGRKYYEQYAPTMLEDFRSGGKIHIKPENRGKFTALLNRTGKTASWYKAHGTPAQKKMAVFALNSRKWKHEDGGLLRNYFEDGGGQTMLAAPGTYLWGNAISNAVGNVVNTIKGEKAYSDSVPQMLPGAAKSADAEALQGILKNSGYDIGTAEPDGYFGKKSTMALQSMLVDAGYDIGSTGSNKNGIDGIIGNKTIAAYNDWVANGARIKKAKRPVGLFREDAMPVSSTDTVSVYTPINSSTVETKPYEGIYNYGQYYDKRFGNYVTDTGLDLSNISTEGVGENKHVDTFSPFVFDNLSQCKKESARNTLECASHITYLNLDDKRGFNIDRNGLRGSAWTMGDNMVKAGGARLFDIFADASAPSGKWDDSYKQRTIDFVRSKAKGEEYENYLMENLQPGDVVELLYPNSRKFKTAYDESKGKHQNTHIGYVVSVGGELYIRDNVGNHTTGAQIVHTRKLSSVVSGKERDGVLITGAVRAKDALEKNGGYEVAGRQGRDMSAIGISPTNNDDASQSRLSNDAAYRAMSAVYNNKNKLLSDNSLSVDEFNRIAGLTQAIMLKESASGELFNNQKWISKNSTLPSIINDANRSELDRARAFGYGVGNPLAYTISDLTGGALSSINAHAEPSSGLGSVKYQGPESLLTDRQRKQLGNSSMIKDALRSSQPETSGVTTFYALCTAVSNIKKILNRYAPRDIAENPDIIDQLAALSYNQGLDKITETLQNAKADGDWDGHLKGLLEATYGKNALILRGYNNTNMFSDEESKKIEEERRNKMNDLRARLQKAGIKADAIANMIAQRESTIANTPIASSGKLR